MRPFAERHQASKTMPQLGPFGHTFQQNRSYGIKAQANQRAMLASLQADGNPCSRSATRIDQLKIACKAVITRPCSSSLIAVYSGMLIIRS